MSTVLGNVLSDWKKYRYRPYVDAKPRVTPYVPKPPATGPRFAARITNEVCDRHKVERYLLLGKSNIVAIVTARNELMYLLREAGWTFLQIAQFVNKHHTTCIHGCRTHKAKMAIVETLEEVK